ncbi:MAG: four helix bundle protein [Kiritimatiellia bacterium]
MSVSGFRELEVWRRSKALAVAVYRVTQTSAFARDIGFQSQMREAAVSVPSNIAEGDERGSARDMIKFLFIAKGSLAELQTQIEIAQDVGMLSSAQANPLLDESKDLNFAKLRKELARMLGGLIKAKSKIINPSRLMSNP